MRNRCKIHLPETEYVKMVQRGLDIKLKKKFQGMEFRDFYELATNVIEYDELLKKENQLRKTSMVCPLLVKKAPNLWKKS